MVNSKSAIVWGSPLKLIDKDIVSDKVAPSPAGLDATSRTPHGRERLTKDPDPFPGDGAKQAGAEFDPPSPAPPDTSHAAASPANVRSALTLNPKPEK